MIRLNRAEAVNSLLARLTVCTLSACPVPWRENMRSRSERAMALVGAMALCCAWAAGLSQVDNSSETERQVRHVTAVKERHEKSLFRLPQVIGVGVGSSQKRRDELAILVYVKRQLTKKELKSFPKTLEGVPVEIVVSGPINALPSTREKPSSS